MVSQSEAEGRTTSLDLLATNLFPFLNLGVMFPLFATPGKLLSLDFGWDRVNIRHSSLYEAVLWIWA